MKGQWIGKYEGSVDGRLMINIDEVGDHYEAVAYVNPNSRDIPASVAYILTEDKSTEQQTTAFINPVNPTNGNQGKWEDIKKYFPPEISHADQADVTIKLLEGKLHIETTSEQGVVLKSILKKPLDGAKSKITGETMSWEQFKSHITKYSKSKTLFRGQMKPWRLRTSFHRHGRYRISKFIEYDVKRLHQRLSSITSHYFDLTNPDQNGAFFNLLQHHGYPTPLLDWSYSPYVAAFFAFRDWPINYSGDGQARIYIFDNEAWQKLYPQILNLDPHHPHLSVMEFIAINNSRLVPQQAITTVTNIDDIEAYLIERESESGTKYLQAIDILANTREEVMRDLRYMGITAGSMFPSIDGICEELKEQNFDE